MSETTDLAVTILRDNRAPDGLLAGHGLALAVRTAETAFLLDTGDSPETWINVDRMGVDISGMQCLVLSHGHYDHTGGIAELLRRVGQMRILAHPQVFEPRWAIDPGGPRFIGQPNTQAEIEAMGAQVELSADPQDIGPGVTTTGEVGRTAWPMPVQTRLQVERDGQSVPDDFIDDMSVVVSLQKASVILTGCAHAGLVNIVERSQEIASRPVRAIIGGTHLMHSTEAEVTELAAELTARGITQMAPLHCTGETGKKFLSTHFTGKTVLAGTGDTILASADGTLTIAPR